MAAPLCYFSFLLMLCFLPCISFPYPKEPNCDSIGIQIPFFRDTSPPNSGGIYMIHCNNLPPTIQFNKKGQNYTVLDIDYHDKILRVRDPKLSHYFQGSDCSFLYVFKNPIPHFNLSLPYKSFFNCEREDYDFSRDCFTKIYNSKICKDYNLHYSYISSHQTPPSCLSHDLTLFEWELSFNESELSLLSASYSNNSYPTPDCLIQQISGDDCSSTGVSGHSKSIGMKNSKKIVIGVAAGGAVLLAACCLFLFLYRRQKSKQHSPSSLLLPTNSSEPSPKKDPELGSVCCQTQTFSYKELEEATDGFDTAKELGDGGFGTVYKGELRDGRTVAVKRLYENNCKRVEQFMNEIVILSRLRHQNLVTLYGYSSRHSRELLLVYEFVPNGTVADHLHGSRVAEGTLTWPIRMNIAIETAEALAYLHAIEPQIIHRDVKTNNILLDNNFHVKVADFGLSRLFPVNATHVSTAPQGTPGYVDPEYHQCYQLTDKSDVYSFGVVLVELISSKPAVDVNRRRHEINLANMAINKIQNGELDQLIDLGLGYELNWEVKSMTTQVAELAFRCLQWDRDMRPPIKEVLEVLRAIRSGWHKTEKAAESDANTRNDTPLLKDALPYSPGSVTDNWVSTSTTSNTSS